MEIGLIGGTSWESTKEYYEIINTTVKKRLGGNNSAKMIIVSLNLQEIEFLMNIGNWLKIRDILVEKACMLEDNGVDALVICTNTLHKVADSVQDEINIPLIHIGEVVAEKAHNLGFSTVGIIGTKFTMQEDFISDSFRQRRMKVLVPKYVRMEYINGIIFDELCQGTISPTSKVELHYIVNSLKDEGAEAIILGCTELQMILNEKETGMPMLDTMTLHALAAAEFALKE